jgi:5'(3')-deoxyribonucleotidase
MRILVDVDGVVADLIGEFCKRWMFGTITPEMITHHKIVKSPEIIEFQIKTSINVGKNFDEFMKSSPYTFVERIKGAREGVKELIKLGHEIVFLTSLSDYPESFQSKYEWISSNFDNLPVITCPSSMKHWVQADAIIDDREDICKAFEDSGMNSFLFAQPWNSSEKVRYDWESIVDFLSKYDNF